MRSVLVALALALGVAVLPAAPVAADPPVDHAPLELQLIDLVNAERAANGLAPLGVYWDLTDDARSHTVTMVESNWLHHNPDLVNVTTGWSRLGENVGYAPSAAILHDAWMDSPGHRANILGDFNYIGIGVEVAGNGLVWGTQVFMKGAAGINVPPASPTRSLQGVVTDIGSGAPLAGVTVTAYDRNESMAGTGVTNASGAYLITGLDPDYYFVGAGTPEVFYPNATELASAVPVSAVLSGDGTGADMQIVGNAAPLANPVSSVTVTGIGTDIELSATDPEGAPLTFSFDVAGLAGTVTGSGPDVSFMPADGFTGTTSFSYIASDGQAASPPATVTITVLETYVSTALSATVAADVTGDGLDDIVHVDGVLGVWVAVGDGSAFTLERWADPMASASWAEFVAGDFDGDGKDDVAGFDESSGRWWVFRSTGSGFVVASWAAFGTKTGWTARVVGDYNGDGMDDIANYHPSLRRWWVSVSYGTGFSTAVWAQFGSGSGWTSQMAGDFNGDGLDDIANFHPAKGRWWLSVSDGSGFTTDLWAELGAGDWANHMVGDFSGDGKDDVAMFLNGEGEWWVSESMGASFSSSIWTAFGTASGWTAAITGDFTGDGKHDIANYHPSMQRWWISESSGSSFTSSMWAQFGTGSGWGPHLGGDFDGDGVADIANFHPAKGRWWTSVSTTSAFATSMWAEIGPTSPF